MVDTSDRVFLGVNEGEWGGGLWHINRNTGGVAAVERYATRTPRGGPLNTACQPPTRNNNSAAQREQATSLSKQLRSSGWLVKAASCGLPASTAFTASIQMV